MNERESRNPFDNVTLVMLFVFFEIHMSEKVHKNICNVV